MKVKISREDRGNDRFLIETHCIAHNQSIQYSGQILLVTQTRWSILPLSQLPYWTSITLSIVLSPMKVLTSWVKFLGIIHPVSSFLNPWNIRNTQIVFFVGLNWNLPLSGIAICIWLILNIFQFHENEVRGCYCCTFLILNTCRKLLSLETIPQTLQFLDKLHFFNLNENFTGKKYQWKSKYM